MVLRFVTIMCVALLLVSQAAAGTEPALISSTKVSPDLSQDYWVTVIASAMTEPTSNAATEPEADAPTEPAGDGEGSDSASLSEKLANPVADLISVPFEFNWDKGYGSKDASRLTLNIQPVIPFHLNEDWNVITRTIVPVVYAESPADGISSDFGLGDTLLSLFFSPREPIRGWIIGAGPAILIPTGTSDLFRSKQLGLGPTAVLLRQDPLGDGKLTLGLLTNHIWHVAGSDDFPDINSTFIQPFVNYSFGKGTSISLNTESSFDWRTEQWTIPINLFASQIIPFGDQPVQFSFGGRYFADAPDDGPEWGLRLRITLLFPK